MHGMLLSFSLFVLSIALACAENVLSLHSRSKQNVPQGFVTTNGNSFELDGKAFAFVGGNSYWLPLLLTADDVDKTLQGMQEAGIKVLRTWGFNAINSTQLADAIATNLTYYQVWDSTGWTLNDGPQGLQRLDNVIATAGKYDIKVILAFTNNWFGYGGSELYVEWIAGQGATHDVFFTDPTIEASYQKYVNVIVDRYKNSSTIFAWELMNEARCLGSDLPAGPNCVAGSFTIPDWYQRQSDFIRSLDSYHMITTGGEGQFYSKNPETYWYNNTLVSDYNFNGDAGDYFEQDLTLNNIDFGVYHMYPQSWYPELDFPGSNFSIEEWGLGWIQDHANAGNKVGKPVVLEEFGLSGLDNKSSIYPSWVEKALETNHAGIMPWQYGQLGLTEDGGNRLIQYTDQIYKGASPNDGNTIYKNQSSVWDIFTSAALIQDQRSG